MKLKSLVTFFFLSLLVIPVSGQHSWAMRTSFPSDTQADIEIEIPEDSLTSPTASNIRFENGHSYPGSSWIAQLTHWMSLIKTRFSLYAGPLRDPYPISFQQACESLGFDLTGYQPFLEYLSPDLRNGLTDQEILAIHVYTGEEFEAINDRLRQETNPTDELLAFTETLKKALMRLPAYEGEVYRAGSLPPEELLRHQMGAIITYPAFTSASLHQKPLLGPHRFIVRSKTGRSIEKFSQFEEEREVLFISGTQFKVLDRKDEDGGVIQFVLQEI